MFKRNTPIANKVLSIIQNTEHALSVSQIRDILDQEGFTPNKTTIYRIIEKLIANKTISVITLSNGVHYYELTKDHHHHFFCNECKLLFCLKKTTTNLFKINLPQLLPSKKFQIKNHDFNLYGICSKCST